MKAANTTLVPIESPINKLMRVVMMGALLPTAAIASLSTNLPIIAISAALKNCCIIPVNASGIAINKIFLNKVP